MSPVNEAFARLASYRKIGDGTKAAALLEPLQDAITILAMSGGSLTPEEDHVLRRFEGHLPVVEMFLEPEHEGWFLRLENRKSDSRSILETEMEEARALYVDHLAKQNGLRNLFNAPETPRLLN